MQRFGSPLPFAVWLSTILIGATVTWLCTSAALTAVATHLEANVEIAESERSPFRPVPPVEPVPSATITAIAPLPGPAKKTEAVQPIAVATAEPQAAGVVAEPTVAVAAAEPDVAVTALDTDRRYFRARQGVNVRARAQSGSARVGTLDANERVAVLDQQQGWMLVQSDAGVSGWVYGRYLSAE